MYYDTQAYGADELQEGGMYGTKSSDFLAVGNLEVIGEAGIKR